MLRYHFCCKPIDLWSQPPFHVETSFLVFCLHASYDSNYCSVYFLVMTWGIRSQQGCFFSYCNSFRDLKSMSRSFFLPILSQLHFLVTIVSTQFSFFFLSRPRKCVATKWWPVLPCSYRSCSNLVTTSFNCSAHFDVAT